MQFGASINRKEGNDPVTQETLTKNVYTQTFISIERSGKTRTTLEYKSRLFKYSENFAIKKEKCLDEKL